MAKKTTPKKSTTKPEQRKPEEPEFEGFMEIGGSPVPGVTLRKIIQECSKFDSWSPNGKYLARDEQGPVRIWDTELGNSFLVAEELRYNGIWMPDSTKLLSWSPSGEELTVSVQGARDPYPEVGPDIQIEYTGSISIKKGIVHRVDDRKAHSLEVRSPDEYRLAVGPQVKILIPSKNRTEWDFSNVGSIDGFAWHPNGEMLAGHGSKTIYVWDIKNGTLQSTLEGHTAYIQHLSFSSDGRLLVSGSENELRLWNTDTWESTSIDNLASLIGHPVFHPSLRLIASSDKDSVMRIWDFNPMKLMGNRASQKSIQYTTAKLVIVGDSGVGKTGLGWRLAHNEFKEHSSTHGQQFWVAPILSTRREDGTECEAVVWDLAGQHVYRSIHSIFLDNVDTSIILFDPTNRQDPLKGAQFWLEQLRGNHQLPPSVLVGARVDRGAPVLSQEELNQFCQKYGVSGGYIGTSAKTGEGIDGLIEIVREQIPWEKKITTITTTTFKKIKEFILSLKEKPDRKGVLVKPAELRTMLEATDPKWSFTDDEMMTAVGHLANHGYVNLLRNSSGKEYILLAVDLLVYLASSIVLLADKHPKELGAVSETDLLQGKYPFDELNGLEPEEQQILIDAAILRFLEHNICFRETTETDTLLVFPSLIKQKSPPDVLAQTQDGTSYMVQGSIENLYARMVVLLSYTPSFTRVHQWQNQSQYVTAEGSICGFKMIEDHEGEIELVLYYGNNTPAQERDNFQILFERFLYQHKVKITPYPVVVCPNGHPQERSVVVSRLRSGKDVLFCSECGERTILPVPAEKKALDLKIPEWLKREEAMAQLKSTYETQIANVKSYRRSWAAPRCYLSFASEQRQFAETIKIGLSEAGVWILEEPSKVEENDSVIMVDSETYEKALVTGSLAGDKKLIFARARNEQSGIITIKQSENKGMHEFENCEPLSFSDETHHVVNLFELVLLLYSIPLENAGFKQLRQALHQQWEQTLAQRVRREKKPQSVPPAGQKEIFISYAWGGESEKLANDLDQAFQKCGVTIVRDKRDLGFKGRIKGFMETIGKGKAVILVISKKYLESENCLFELLQIARHGNFEERIFPVVLEDARIYKPIDRIHYVQYWEQQLKELDDAMKTVSATNMHGFREDIDLYADIRANLPRLTDILKDMNTLTPAIHRDEDFQTLINAVMIKLEE
jgi:small GTP-binding protein